MLVKTGTLDQMTYQDKCIRSAVAYLGNLDTDSVSKLLYVAKECYADMLSQISIFTKIAKITLDNYGNINTELLAAVLDNEKKAFIKNSFDSNSLDNMQAIIKEYTNNVTSAQDQLIDMYGLKQGDLSVFNYDNNSNNLNFKSSEDMSPITFKYYEGKMTLKNTTNLLKTFTNMKNIYEQNRKSISILSTDKASDVLIYFINTLNNLKKSLESIKFVLDSLSVADNTATKFLLSNDKYCNSFLGRNYDTIKADIINSYFS